MVNRPRGEEDAHQRRNLLSKANCPYDAFCADNICRAPGQASAVGGERRWARLRGGALLSRRDDVDFVYECRQAISRSGAAFRRSGSSAVAWPSSAPGNAVMFKRRAARLCAVSLCRRPPAAHEDARCRCQVILQHSSRRTAASKQPIQKCCFRMGESMPPGRQQLTAAKSLASSSVQRSLRQMAQAHEGKPRSITDQAVTEGGWCFSAPPRAANSGGPVGSGSVSTAPAEMRYEQLPRRRARDQPTSAHKVQHFTSLPRRRNADAYWRRSQPARRGAGDAEALCRSRLVAPWSQADAGVSTIFRAPEGHRRKSFIVSAFRTHAGDDGRLTRR